MAVEPDPELIAPDEIAYRLELTPAQLKITHAALKSYLDDFGHDERDVHRVVHEVLHKLPDEHSIRAIDLNRELRGIRPARSAPPCPVPHRRRASPWPEGRSGLCR